MPYIHVHTSFTRFTQMAFTNIPTECKKEILSVNKIGISQLINNQIGRCLKIDFPKMTEHRSMMNSSVSFSGVLYIN